MCLEMSTLGKYETRSLPPHALPWNTQTHACGTFISRAVVWSLPRMQSACGCTPRHSFLFPLNVLKKQPASTEPKTEVCVYFVCLGNYVHLIY